MGIFYTSAEELQISYDTGKERIVQLAHKLRETLSAIEPDMEKLIEIGFRRGNGQLKSGTLTDEFYLRMEVDWKHTPEDRKERLQRSIEVNTGWMDLENTDDNKLVLTGPKVSIPCCIEEVTFKGGIVRQNEKALKKYDQIEKACKDNKKEFFIPLRNIADFPEPVIEQAAEQSPSAELTAAELAELDALRTRQGPRGKQDYLDPRPGTYASKVEFAREAQISADTREQLGARR